MFEHMKNHKVEYLSFFVVGFLIVATLNGVRLGTAVTTPIFQGYIGEAPAPSPGDHLGGFLGLFYVVLDSQGNMYAADVYNVYKFDSSGNFLLSFAGYGTGNGFVSGISGLAVDSNENVYIKDSGGTNDIQKFDASGNYVLRFGSQGSGDGQFGVLVGIAVGPSGNVYVADYDNDRIQVFDASGNFITKWGSTGSGDGQFKGPNSIAIDSDENIYVLEGSKGNDRVQKFASTTAFVAKWGSTGSGDGQFISGSGVAVASSSIVYVADTGNNRIQVFDASGNFITKWGSTGSGDGQFDTPTSLAVDHSGGVYVVDSVHNRIEKFDTLGNYLNQWNSAGQGDGEFYSPQGVAYDSQGNIYVADTFNHRIQKFDTLGNYVTQFGSEGSDTGQFIFPSDVAIDSLDNVYIVDQNDRVQKFSSTTVFVSQWGSTGSGDGQFNYPNSITIDSSDNIYVLDAGTGRVQKFDTLGNYLSQFGTFGNGDGEFNNPTGIAADTLGNIYVSDSVINNRIQKFDSSGNFITKWGTLGSGDGEFANQQSIAIDKANNVYVADTLNARIQKFDSNGNFLIKFGTPHNPEEGGFIAPYGLKVLPDGRIIIADAGNSHVVVWGLPPLLFTNIVATNPTATSTTISWTTSLESSTQVDFGYTDTFSSSTVMTDLSPRVTSHSVTLEGAPSCSILYYRVRSVTDEQATSTSATQTTTTGGCVGSATTLATTTVDVSIVSTSTLTLTTLTLSIPPDFASTSPASTTFQAVKLEPVAFMQEASKPAGKELVGSDVYHLKAIDQIWGEIATFDAPIEVSMTYNPANLTGIDPTSLRIWRFDGTIWHELTGCTIDSNTSTVTCETSNFSDFAIFGTPAPGSSSVILAPSYFVNSSGQPVETQQPTVTQPSTTTTIALDLTRTTPPPSIVATSTNYFRQRFLYRGTKGEDVSALQKTLNSLSKKIYPQGLITGYFGFNTYEAILRFQCEYGIVCGGDEITTGWGVMGPKTTAKILELQKER